MSDNNGVRQLDAAFILEGRAGEDTLGRLARGASSRVKAASSRRTPCQNESFLPQPEGVPEISQKVRGAFGVWRRTP